MANHSKHARSSTFAMPSKSSLVKIAATVAAVGLLATGGIVSRNLYTSAEQNTANQVTAFSVTDSAEASRGNARELLNGDTSYVTVKINGKSRVVPGTNFTDVKSVLDAGDITLEPEDTVSPSLTTKVDEKTVITIQRAGASVEVSDTAIGFNVVKKETSSLPEGQEKVETEGEEGVMETTNLVTKSGDTVVSSNMISSYVKKAPVDKVILVGTVYIITHESGWSVTATNPSSGAYGLPQALPGSKMVSAGADWATNYQTQLKWFWGYCAQRYGSIQGAYTYWLANHCY